MKKDYAPESSEESFGVSRESHDYYAAHARQWRNRVGLVVFVVVLAFWSYTLFVTPFFDVQSITISGVSQTTQKEIHNRVEKFLSTRRWGIVPRKNIFLLRRSGLVDLFRSDARIATLQVQKNYQSRSLTIIAEERTTAYIFVLPDRAFTIDKEGMTLAQLPLPLSEGTTPLIYDKRLNEGVLGQKIVAENEIVFLNSVTSEFARSVPFINITIGEPSQDAITFVTKEGWGAYFAFTDSASAQLERLKVLLATKIKPEKRKKLEYIDLRFGERVYYK